MSRTSLQRRLAKTTNLITSLHRDGRHVIAVILGGKSSSERDLHMRKLIAAEAQQQAPMSPLLSGASPIRSTDFSKPSASEVFAPFASTPEGTPLAITMHKISQEVEVKPTN